MSIAIEDDHLALLATARRFTADRCPPAVAARRWRRRATGRRPPPFWDELAELGWLGLAVPEAEGGEGYGFAELAVVLEELGRVVAPGTVLPTAWAAPSWPATRTPAELVARGGSSAASALRSALVGATDGDRSRSR